VLRAPRLAFLGRGAGLGDLVLHRVGTTKRAAGLAVPIARIAEIAFQRVHDAVQPSRQLRRIVLHDLVRLLPLALRQQQGGF
jgi:hypothetical protein